jgi:hypothetical protein
MFAYGEASPQELKTALVGRRLSKGGLKHGHYLRLDHTSAAESSVSNMAWRILCTSYRLAPVLSYCTLVRYLGLVATGRSL